MLDLWCFLSNLQQRRVYLFCAICIFFFSLTMKSRHYQNVAGWEHCTAFYIVLVLEIYFYSRKILVSNLCCSNVFKAIDSPEKVLSKAQPRYVTCKCCFILIFYSFPAFLILCLLAKRTNLVLSSPRCMINLLSTNQSQTFSKSLFSCFSVSLTSLCWYTRYESAICTTYTFKFL